MPSVWWERWVVTPQPQRRACRRSARSIEDAVGGVGPEAVGHVVEVVGVEDDRGHRATGATVRSGGHQLGSLHEGDPIHVDLLGSSAARVPPPTPSTIGART